MVSLHLLWLPILLSAVFVFVASSVIHMLLPYHRSDFKGLPREEETMAALRPLAIPPGEYVMPYAPSPEAMKSPEFQERATQGPVAFMNVLPNGVPGMGASLVQWFGYCLVIGLFAGYLTSRAVGFGAPYLEVFRFAGTTAFLGYAAGLWQNSIWYKRAWSTTLKSTFDGLLYGLLTAGTFGWLWPN